MHHKDREILELRTQIKMLDRRGKILKVALTTGVILLAYMVWLKFHIVNHWPSWLP